MSAPSMNSTCACGCGKTPRLTRRGINKFVLGHNRAVHRGATDFKKTPEYMSYTAARDRCNNPNRTGYYGRVEFRFFSFQDFFAEVGSRPDGTTLDRIESNGHYEKGNVRWATPLQQIHNRRPRSQESLTKAAHTRWHIVRGVVKADCLHCVTAKVAA